MKEVVIHSVPRSGSTWLGNIFNSHPKVIFKFQPLFSYAFKNYLGPTSSRIDIENFFEELLKTNDEFIDQKEGIQKGIIPSFNKEKPISHICYKEVRYHNILFNMLEKSTETKFIFLIRNPLNVINSWYKAPKEFRNDKGWKIEEEWLYAEKKNLNKLEEFNGYLKWKEAAYIFLELKEKFPSKVEVIRYEELVVNTTSIVKKLFDFVELEFSKQTSDFIISSSSKNDNNPYSVFKIVESDDKWKELPSFIINYVREDLKGDKLEKFML